MKSKSFFSNEAAYVVGIITISFGVAFMEKADWGVSMVVAPAYLLYLKLSQIYSFFTFGMAEYTLQAFLLIVMMIILRRFRLSYFFSFVTAVIYGFALDGAMMVVESIPTQSVYMRAFLYIVGMILSAVGISFFFHSYISPEVYELFVKEISKKTGMNINKFKTFYDISSAALAVLMSFIFFGWGHFEGVKLGTLFCTLINGSLIGIVSKLLDSIFIFKDSLPLRKYFEDQPIAQ